MAKYQPLKTHEDVCIFSVNTSVYNPVGVLKCNIKRDNVNRHSGVSHISNKEDSNFIQTGTGYPKSIQSFNVKNRNRLHPTQKPVALMEYMIKTYTNEGETVLDFTMGSGTTLVAAKELGRKCIGIELEEKYVEIAIKRLRQEVFDFNKEGK